MFHYVFQYLTRPHRVYRFSLEVVQHPVQGRSFTELRDRRTLQPIAIVTIRCWQCFSRLEGMSDMVDELPSLLEDDMLWEEVEMGVEYVPAFLPQRDLVN